MNPYFTSDLHLGHKLAAYKRGFESTEQHDLAVINSLREVDNKRVVFWILGDVAMDERRLHLLGELQGRKILVRGNHDTYKLRRYTRYFEEVHGIIKYKNMWVSHCPIHPQEMYRADANLHGHIHKGTDSPELSYPYINVNWDFHQRPLSLDEIRSIIEEHKCN